LAASPSPSVRSYRMNNVAAEMEHLHKLAKGTTGQGNPGKIEFGTPGARKRACPVWGGLGGNVWQQCRNAPPFHSIIAAARPSKCCVTTASDSISSPAGFRKAAFAGGPKIKTRRSTHSRRNSSRSFFIMACPIKPALRLLGGSYPVLKLKPPAIPLPHPCNSTADTDPDCFARPSCCE